MPLIFVKVMDVWKWPKIAKNESSADSDQLYRNYIAKNSKMAKTREICFFNQKKIIPQHVNS